jgi:ribonuclease HII
MRTEPDLAFERRLWKHGFTYVAGMDEAGRGALAGPVAVGVVILPIAQRRGAATEAGQSLHGPADGFRSAPPRVRVHRDASLRGVRDSKQMTPAQRDSAAVRIRARAVAWSVGFASCEEIDTDGIVRATRLAALRALEQLWIFPEYLLTDFRLELPQLDIGQTSLVKGDARCLSIAAASVLAKTGRDALMRELDAQQPGYGLARHKGYGTRDHLLALRRMGRSPIHRRTFAVGF